jgi:hypothetical protein
MLTHKPETLAPNCVRIFASGITCCAVCAPKDFDRTKLEKEITSREGRGAGFDWKVYEGEFPDNANNPRPCPHDPARQHWLLVC